MIKKVSVVGMGSLGLLFGVHILDRVGEGNFSFVMDEGRAKKYRDTEFNCHGRKRKLPIVSSEDATESDLVIVSTKYGALNAALSEIRKCVGDETIIISLLNGISSEEIISSWYGKEHVVYAVAQGMDAMREGTSLFFTKMGEIRLGAREECQKKNLSKLDEFFTSIGLPHTVDEDIMHRLWGKFMLNVGVNQCAMAYETGYGGCLNDEEPYRMMISAMREVIALANAEGIHLTEDDLESYVKLLGTLSPEGMPSMRQDGLFHRKTEVEMFSLTVIERAKAKGLRVPVNEYLYKRITEMEKGYLQSKC